MKQTNRRTEVRAKENSQETHIDTEVHIDPIKTQTLKMYYAVKNLSG